VSQRKGALGCTSPALRQTSLIRATVSISAKRTRRFVGATEAGYSGKRPSAAEKLADVSDASPTLTKRPLLVEVDVRPLNGNSGFVL